LWQFADIIPGSNRARPRVVSHANAHSNGKPDSDCYCHRDSCTYRHSHRNGYTHRDGHSYCYRDRNSYCYCYRCTYRDGHRNRYSYRDGDCHSNSYCYGNSYTYRHSHGNGYAYRDGHRHRYGNRNSRTYCHGDGCTNSYGYGHRYCVGDRNSRAFCNRHSDTYSNPGPIPKHLHAPARRDWRQGYDWRVHYNRERSQGCGPARHRAFAVQLWNPGRLDLERSDAGIARSERRSDYFKR
jgi:hypothetical protein